MPINNYKYDVFFQRSDNVYIMPQVTLKLTNLFIDYVSCRTPWFSHWVILVRFVFFFCNFVFEERRVEEFI